MGPVHSTLLAVTACAIALATIAGPAHAEESRDARLAKAMKLHDARASYDKHKAAALAFAELAKDFPDDRELQLWCARTAYYMAHRAQQPKQKVRIAKRGVECAARMTKANPEDYDAQILHLLTQFRQKAAEGVGDALSIAPKIRDVLMRLVKTKPKRYEAYMMLGVMYRELPGLPLSFGNSDTAVKLLEKAEKLAPKDAEVLLELAMAYDKVGRTDDARKAYQVCINESPARPPTVWETKDAKSYAKKMLAELN